MSAPSFISRRLTFRGRVVIWSIAVSVLVVIVSVSVAAGFRKEILAGISDSVGDVRVAALGSGGQNVFTPFSVSDTLEADILSVEGVKSISMAIYEAGIVRNADNVHGVVFKGVEGSDSVSLNVKVPQRLASLLELSVGDRLQSYFVEDRLAVRNFTVSEIYDGLSSGDDKLVVLCDIAVLRRVRSLPENSVSAIEIQLEPGMKDAEAAETVTEEIQFRLWEMAEDIPLAAVNIYRLYGKLFDWLGLIGFNVRFILILMIVVAALNMVSGLLILLFENTSTIGLLKSMGMTVPAIAGTFLLRGARLVMWGFLTGNLIGTVLCLIQKFTRVLTLNPENYFLSFVPVDIDLVWILAFDVTAFAAIMLVQIVPCIFISRVDPAQSLRMR